MKFALGIICGTTAVLLAALIVPTPDVALAHLQATITSALGFALGVLGFAYAVASFRQGWYFRCVLGVVTFLSGLYLATANSGFEDVSVSPVVVSELKFGNVERQIFTADLMECADHPALWLWMMLDHGNDVHVLRRGFLHTWYYQSLSRWRSV